MTILRRVPAKLTIWEASYVADSALATAFTVVAPGANASGKMTIDTAPSQGGLTVGVLQKAVAEGGVAQVMKLGVSPVVSAETFNTGVELTCSGTTGTLEAGASGDWICGIAQEGSAEAGQIVAMELSLGYYKD